MSSPNPVWIHNLIYYSTYPYGLNHLGEPSAHFVRFITRKIEQLEERVMAKKTNSPGNNQDWQNTVFVNYRLGKDEKAAFEEWSSRKADTVALDLAQFMSSGAKTSITWDSKNNVWIVSATMKDESHKSYNECLTSRSDDWYEAMRLNAYKALVLAKNGKWSDLSADEDWG